MAPSLTGRAIETASVNEALRAGHAIVVRGKPGIGVSALLAKARQLATDAGLRTVDARVEEYAASPVSVLEDLMAELGAVGARGSEHHLLDTFGPALARLAPERVVLVVDDAHRAGPTVLAVLAEAGELAHVSVVLGAHGATGDLTGMEQTLVLDLPGLDRTSVAAIVSRRLGEELSPSSPLVASYARASAGNPLLLDALLDDPAITEAMDRTRSLDDPTSIVPQLVSALPQIVRQRLTQLSEGARGAVAIVALAGDGAPTELLTALAEPEHLRAGCAARLLEEDEAGGFAFTHRAVMRLVAQDVPRARRLEVNLALGHAARQLGLPAASVARHLLVAIELDPAAAVSAAQRAAAQATALGAQVEASQLLARAAESGQGSRLPRLADHT